MKTSIPKIVNVRPKKDSGISAVIQPENFQSLPAVKEQLMEAVTCARDSNFNSCLIILYDTEDRGTASFGNFRNQKDVLDCVDLWKFRHLI